MRVSASSLRVPLGALLVAILLSVAGGAADAARGDGCRRRCAVERRECRQAMKLEKRRERKACEAAADPTRCRAGVETRMQAQLATCTVDRRSCRRCCRGGGLCVTARAVEFCGTDADCNDSDPCTDDICDGALGCMHAPLAAPCDDGIACTAGDACADGACVGGSPAPGCSACAGAAVIPPQGGTFLGATSGTGTLAGSCPDSAVAPERVYQWTPARSGTAVIGTCGSGTGYDTIVYLRSGTCEAGTEVTCNDDTAGCAVADGTPGADHHGSSLTAAVTAGETYFIVVDGFQGKGGSYALSVVPPSVCGDNVREGAEQCDGTDRAGCPSGACAAGCTCVPPAGGLPDLIPGISDVTLQRGATVPSGDVAEGCAAATSGVDLLRFATTTENVGTADVILGDPLCPDCATHPLEVCGNPQITCAPAGGHGHGHYANYARYELLDATGRVAVVGRKQGFCLRDNACPAPVYTCAFQGISAGCADVYGVDLGCQYLDVTGVPDGNYTLRVTVDPFARIAELNETNNVTTLAVVLGSDSCTATDLPAAGGTFTGTTAGASAETGSCAAQSGLAPEQVFRWTPTASGTATISTCGAATGFDTVVYVREASCTGTEVACSDDADGCGTGDGCATADHHGSVVTPTVTAGQTYFIVVDGFAGSCGGSEGAFTLSVVPPAGGGATTTTTLAATTTTSLVTTTTLAATTTTTLVTTTTIVAPTTTTTTRPEGTSTTTSSTTTTSVTTTTVAGNHAPSCDHALALPPLLWPPNHRLVDVEIVGVSDRDGDRVSLTITGIRQDEPVLDDDDKDRDGDRELKPLGRKDDDEDDDKGKGHDPGDGDDGDDDDDDEDGDGHGGGSGQTCPDATGVGSPTASVRAERAGSGNGRVYHVAFRADDGRGGSCSDTVRVCVLHDRGHDGFCKDGGPEFDSTGPCPGPTPEPGPEPPPPPDGNGDDDVRCAGLEGRDLFRCICAGAAGAGCFDGGLAKRDARRLGRACKAVTSHSGGKGKGLLRRAETLAADVARGGTSRSSAACRTLLGSVRGRGRHAPGGG